MAKNDARQRQIDSLKLLGDNVQHIKDNEHYLVRFSNTSGQQFQLDLLLSDTFPMCKPTLRLTPSIEHPWLHCATGEIVKAPCLNNFGPHSDLAFIVKSIMNEFSNTKYSTVAVAAAMSSAGGSTGSHDISSYLATLSVDDLKELDENDECMADFVEELDVVQQLHDRLTNLMNDVESIADENINHEMQQNELNQSIDQSKLVVKDLAEKYDKSSREYFRKSEEFSPNHIKELLKISVSTADVDSDKHVQDFLNGKLDTLTFLDQFLKVKALSALRKAKVERLTHQLNALEKATY